VVFGVDADGNAVGDDRSSLQLPVGPRDGRSPILWRAGKEIRLSESRGTAFAISKHGTIVGTTAEGGFTADVRDVQPGAALLDGRVAGLGNMHILAALGVADDETILALVRRANGTQALAKLTPQRRRP
jgi:hypothetical protein